MRVPPTDRILAILGYHKIGPPAPGGWETWFYVPEATFVAHLNYLSENGWAVLDIAGLFRGLVLPDSLPERMVLITFDDGYRSIRDVALPCLLRFGYPAVLFVPSDFIGSYNRFEAGEEPEEAICDWHDLLELERAGVSVQSHGASHRHFSGLDPVAQEEELVRSKATLEAGLGKAVEVFAFPYGDEGTDPEAVGRALKHTGYRAACLYGGSPLRLPLSEPFRLARLAMGPDTDLRAELTMTRQENG